MIFMDDPSELPLFEETVRGRSVVLLDGYRESSGLSTPSRLMEHQAHNVNTAINFSLANNITWLMHIDTDEIFYDEGDRSWMENAGHVTFQNYEAVPLQHEPTNYFADCSLFRTGGQGYSAYGIGKSAVRVTPGVSEWGPHYFKDYKGESRAVEHPVILHYPTTSFARWVAKYRLYGNFSDYWNDDINQPNQLGFMLQSRRVVQKALVSGNWDEAHEFYDSHIPDGKAVQQLLVTGELRRLKPFLEN
jgi:hypothetical protein